MAKRPPASKTGKANTKKNATSKSAKSKSSSGGLFSWGEVLQYRAAKALVLFILAVLLLMFFLLWQGLFRALPMNTSSQMLSIKQGQTYSGLIRQLAEKDQLRFPIVAKIYQRLFIHDTLKAGVYEVKRGTSVQELLLMLSNGELAQMNRVLVIEGTTFGQLRRQLMNNPDVTQTLTGLDNTALLQKLDINETHPEGWFAPDTYYFSKGETDANILKHLYKAQKRIVEAAWQQREPGLPYKNAYEALIMASIVEKETGIKSERADVAGVFVRRLKIGMRLQTDPTVIYGMGSNYNGNIRRADLLAPTAYNTYVINGLPPTPIALPSKAAIEAALHPAPGNSLYFVATGNGGHKFSATLQEHNQAVADYLTVLRQKRAAAGE